MRDAVGNRLEEGQMILLRSQGLIYRVVRVQESTLDVPREDRPAARLVLQLDMPVPVDNLPRGEEPQLVDVFRIVDPAQEEVLDRIAARGRTQ